MSAHDVFYKIWRFVRIPLAVVVVLLVGLTIYRFPYALEQRRAEEVVEFIRAQKITLNDVNGVNLPLAPDPAEVDATVEGVDANKNWIRDDVELAIFERYPNDARIRAAMLQYAMGLQLELHKYLIRRRGLSRYSKQVGDMVVFITTRAIIQLFLQCKKPKRLKN